MLLANSDVDHAQRISILAAALSNITDSSLDPDATKDLFLESINYKSNDSIIRQCEKQKISVYSRSIQMSTHTINSVSGAPKTAKNSSSTSRSRKRLSTAEFADLKKNRPATIVIRRDTVPQIIIRTVLSSLVFS